MKECVECGKRCEGDVWQSGEVCLFGMLFACSVKCAETYAQREAKPGYKPGEPGYRAEVEP